MEQDMLDKSAKLFEIIHGHEQLRKSLIEETNKDLEKTENVFETQVSKPKQYLYTTHLVSVVSIVYTCIHWVSVLPWLLL